jgi:hypothetical protein
MIKKPLTDGEAVECTVASPPPGCKASATLPTLPEVCEICDTREACLSGEAPCDLCGHFLAVPRDPLHHLNKLANLVCRWHGRAIDNAAVHDSRVKELIEANNVLVEAARDAQRRCKEWQDATLAVTKELAAEKGTVRRLRADLAYARRSAGENLEGWMAASHAANEALNGGVETHPDRDTTGGFDVVGDQPHRAGGTRQCFP